MLIKFSTIVLLWAFVLVQSTQAQMSSSSFQIRWDALSTESSDTGSSASYIVRDSIDATSASRAEGSTYTLDQGYRSGVHDEFIALSIVSSDSSTSRSAQALAGTTVTTSTSGLSVNQYIAVVQNLGASQVSAIGRIASIGAGTVTVDAWSTNGTTPTIDGTSDYVFVLTGSTASLGELSESSVKTSIIGIDVSIDDAGGYTVQLVEDGNLRAGSNTVNDVSDGSVTAGSEEYGAVSSDISLSGSTFDTQDTSISTSYQDVVTRASLVYKDRHFITLKASIDALTEADNYAHTLTFIVSANL